MELVLQKYGGTSVATVDRIKDVARKIIKKKKQGYSLVVVVSAMGETTDRLIELANSAVERPEKRELDMLISTGEQVSSALLSMIINEMGHPAVALTGFQAGVKTKGIHTKNKITDIDTCKIKKFVDESKIVVVAGFQGINENGDIATLGRGGSDITAVALAAKLKCACEIYTDVTGIYSVDPRECAKSKKLSYICYEEMIEMSHLGAKVMASRALEIGQKFSVPIYVASSTEDVEGTYIIDYKNDLEQRHVTGLSVNENIFMINLNELPYNPASVAEIFLKLAEAEILVDMVNQSSAREGCVDLSFTISTDDFYTVDEVLGEIKGKLPTVEISKNKDVVKLSVIGMGMRAQCGGAAKVFKLFAENDIHFSQVTTSDISMSYTIAMMDKQKAIDVITSTFDLVNC